MKQLTTAVTPLEVAVQTSINAQADEYANGVHDFMDYLKRGGGSSGTIWDLCNRTETVPFFETHKVEINRLLVDNHCSPMTAIRSVDAIRDVTDPLCLEGTNQEGLAWFAFEVIAKRLCDREPVKYPIDMEMDELKKH